MELHVNWCLIQSAEAGGPRSTLAGSEFDLSDIDLPHAALAACLQVGFNEGLASYLTWLFSRPDEQTCSAVLNKAEREAIALPPTALALNAAAFEFLHGASRQNPPPTEPTLVSATPP